MSIVPVSRRTWDKHADPLEFSGGGSRTPQRIVAKLRQFSG